MRITKAIALLGLVSITGCINEDLRLYEVALTGEFTTSSPGGVVHIELHHASSGSGELERPLGLIERWTLDAGELGFDAELLVDTDEGEGLVVYAWLDLDGDGVLCSIDGDRSEPAGASELAQFPAHTINFMLALDQPCVGPELAWP